MTAINTDADFKELYCNYFNRIRNFANTYLHDEESASSVAQDVFTTVYEKKASLTLNESILPYLFVLAKNRCINILKKEKSKQRYEQDKLHNFYVNLAVDALERQTYSHDYRKLQEIYTNTISALPDNIRETFLLSRDKNLKYREIALKQNISVKTVEYRIMYVLKIFRQKLEGYIVLLLLLILE